jgi:hypothetical protein
MNRVLAKGFWVLPVIVVLLGTSVKASIELKQSVFDREGHKLKYDSPLSDLTQPLDAGSDEFSLTSVDQPSTISQKSPAKAFFLSLAVPGLGQFYYGSKIKPLVFLSAEVVSWAFYAKWHGDGNDLTDKYEAFNQNHWSRDSYENKYLLWTYGVTDDDSVNNATEVTHHLPDDMTQQYYEMTGKYNQFAWGWDDATLNDSTLEELINQNPNTGRPIKDDASTPYSARRLQYEKMRDDANNKYDQATRMIFVSMANRLISAFEAYFVTRHRNNKTKGTGIDLTSFKVRAGLKSYHAQRDTPFFTVTYKF